MPRIRLPKEAAKAARKLSPKRKLFAEEYAVDFNGARAARAAGYSAKTARTQASAQLLTNSDVQAVIQGAVAAKVQRAQITQDYLMGVIQDRMERCVNEDDPYAVYKGAELLGRSTTVKAWSDRVELIDGNVLVDKIKAGRKRAGKAE